MIQLTDPWNEYRKLRNIFLVALVGFVPAVMGAAVLSMRLFSTFTPAYIVAFGWMAFILVSSNMVQQFRCPRCGKWFFAKTWHHNQFAEKCMHCGLYKYEDPNSSE